MRKRFTRTVATYNDGYGTGTGEVIIPDENGELWGSKDGDQHWPVFDVDTHLLYLIPSYTPGHFHMYFDSAISWRQYKKLIKAMAEAGMIDPEWARLTLNRKAGYVLVNPRLKAAHAYRLAKQKRAEERKQTAAERNRGSSWY